MDRNVYSIVLLEKLVDAVDRLACEQGISRSGMINRILADYLSCATPEERIGNIFSCMEQYFSAADNFQVRSRQSETMLTIRSSLKYRYHPTVRYALELFRENSKAIGELRVTLRTKSPVLEELLTEFFTFRGKMEQRWLGAHFPGDHVPYEIGPGRFTRTLVAPASEQDRTAEKTSEAICDYILEFDRELKHYCAGSDSPIKTQVKLEWEYQNHIKKNIII
ncbi:ribbon-helix-helix domain-containing protein [Caproicibacter sp.]|uniref:ribbon-helix-helix domain-containing protein n=1 Tax=Caproicibacter sp. TaxID=2814884 RepID=UPI00398A4D7E